MLKEFLKQKKFSVVKKLLRSVGESNFLGVDIGTASIKAAELEASPLTGAPRLNNYAILESYSHLDRLNTAIQTSSLKMLEKETAELLRAMLKKLGSKTKNAVASIPSFLAFTSLVEVPALSPQELAQTMRYQAQVIVPLPLSEVAIDWIPVGEYTDEKGVKKQQVFLVSVPNEVVLKYRSVFKAAGLNLKALEIEGLSLARALTFGDPTSTLLVDIGARSTAIMVAENGLLKYNAQTDFAGSSLTQAVAGGLGVSVRRAEELKKQKGLLGQGGEYGLSTLMMPFLDVILSEVKRAKNIYEENYHGKIERVMLSGGGANLLGIEKYASSELQLPVVKADPWKKVEFPAAAAPILAEIGAPLAVAIGLGIRQFIS
ncbi:MAG: type IV pilus assembly protein PilM [Patescibacteria group bacterium]|nr:type IV pilus assembly protein PilM [Patescibacteria group bacterium]MDE2144633.1 type IV pilus assembly protein PilM [Patescibacteria group bacterium]